MSRLQNVFIIWFYYKQHWPMLKNEVKKTTTWPPRPSARQTGPKWTTHSVSVKLCIKEILEYKQTANKPPPATQRAFSACFHFHKQRRHRNSVIANASFEYGLFGVACRQKQTLVCRTSGFSHPAFQSVFCECCLCLCVTEREKRGKRGREIKGFNCML